MELFGTDISIKYIYVEDEHGNEYGIIFRHGLLRGYYDISLYKKENGRGEIFYTKKSKFYKENDESIKVKLVYPPLIKMPKEIWTIIICEFERIKRKAKKRINLKKGSLYGRNTKRDID
ncbi:hypothetical protein [Longicatena caecimuris]|uniref:hypothetical protein n=1 Tax=Longicatena caecimuris TaxID=1796635 RepID=UPI0018AC5ED4|nr:hypothetical protein [Longicatena caecimuris]